MNDCSDKCKYIAIYMILFCANKMQNNICLTFVFVFSSCKEFLESSCLLNSKCEFIV